MTYWQTKALVAMLIECRDKKWPQEIRDNIDLTLISIYREWVEPNSDSKSWAQIASDIASTGIDLNA